MEEKYISNIIEYQKKMNECKEYREKYLLIDNGKEIIEGYNIKLMPNFNSYHDPYINEQLKFMKLITDLDVVNQNIIESHEIWKKIKEEEKNVDFIMYNNYLFKRISKLHEYIVFDLRHFIDEIIATIAVIKDYISNDEVLISSIGEYLSKKQEDFKDFDEFKDLFEKLNNLSNCYKHSYANSDFSAVGRDEDCFIALYSKYNNFSDNPTPYVVSINYIVQEFNKFYKYSFNLIDSLTSNKLK